MSKPEAYPFLRIARQYGADYGDVLTLADSVRRADDAGHAFLATTVAFVPFSVFADIARATEVQQSIRDGEIDWLTGEPR